MAFHISSSTRSIVLSPGAAAFVSLSLRGPDGPVSSIPVAMSSVGDAARVRETSIETDDTGTVRLEIIGVSEGRAVVTARADKDQWQGEIIVTNVDVTLPQDLSLSRADEDLLRMLFRDKREVQVIRQFGGGVSGNRVLQVRAFDDSGAYLTQVVKIGLRDEIQQEGENYKLFDNRLAQAAPVGGFAVSGVTAAIIYGDARATAALEPMTTLADYFESHPRSAVHAALFAVLGAGLRHVYSSFETKNVSPRQLVGIWYPENLVVSLDQATGGYGMFAAAEHQKSRATDAIEMSPLDVERAAGNHPALKPGDAIVLRGFRVSKVQPEDLNLEDENARKYRIKVRFNGAKVEGFSVGDKVDVFAHHVTDRATRLYFAVTHCLRSSGFESGKFGYLFSGEAYPEPLALLPSILDERWNFAWAAIHGDLHWENVMAESPQNWWLIDYGLTRRGAVLFDFIKLELYLRTTILSKNDRLTPANILSFEQELRDNPFGHLPADRSEDETVEKAIAAIQAIRRLAEPFMLDGFAAYRALLYAYAFAVMKYYPTEDHWKQAKQDPEKSRKLESQSRPCFFAMAVVLSLARVIVSEREAKREPTLTCRFVPVGSQLNSEPGCIALDIGNQLTEGVIDHHHLREGKPESATSLVWSRPELLTGHAGVEDTGKITWVLHQDPDFDGIAAMYLTWHRLKYGFFPAGADQLQRYAKAVDAGKDFLERVPFPERTPYAVFMAYLARVPDIRRSTDSDHKRVKLGLEIMRYLCRLEAAGVHAMADNRCPHEHPFWGSEIEDDEDKFWLFDRHNAVAECMIGILIDGHVTQVRLLAVQSPQSLLFPAWARRHDYPLTIVRSPQPDKPDQMMIISVPPSLTNSLKGLGAALDIAETTKRAGIPDKQRPVEPKRDGYDNSDPWYDGRSPAHNYTIVAAPRVGTVLTMSEVVEIVKSSAWHEV